MNLIDIMQDMQFSMRDVKPKHTFDLAKITLEQKSLQKAAVAGDYIGRVAITLAEQRHPVNTELQKWQGLYTTLADMEYRHLDNHITHKQPLPPDTVLQPIRTTMGILSDKITKLEKIRETELDRYIKILKSEYDKAFAIHSAKKLEREQFWHSLAVAGVAWANHAGQDKLNYLGDLIKGLIKAVLEDKI